MNLIYNDETIQLFNDDAFEYMKTLASESIDTIITDPPYFLSNGGFSNSGGKRVSVNKGNWDEMDKSEVKDFYRLFLTDCMRVLSSNGTIWIFGTMHNIYLIGYLLHSLGFRILNNITWQKTNPAPNLSRRMFTHSTETILWAKKAKGKQLFNYDLMREINGGKQMKDVWKTATINKSEKRFGNHPTQKPLSLLKRIISASTEKQSIILDPFVGSGTTAVAGKMLDRHVIGVEESATYIKIAKQRIEDYRNERVGKII